MIERCAKPSICFLKFDDLCNIPGAALVLPVVGADGPETRLAVADSRGAFSYGCPVIVSASMRASGCGAHAGRSSACEAQDEALLSAPFRAVSKFRYPFPRLSSSYLDKEKSIHSLQQPPSKAFGGAADLSGIKYLDRHRALGGLPCR